MPTGNVAIAQEGLDSFTETHDHQPQATASQHGRILAALIEIADNLGTRADKR